MKGALDLRVRVLEGAVFVAEDGQHVVLRALAFFQGHCPEVRGQSSLGHHRHQAFCHPQPEDTHPFSVELQVSELRTRLGEHECRVFTL